MPTKKKKIIRRKVENKPLTKKSKYEEKITQDGTVAGSYSNSKKPKSFCKSSVQRLYLPANNFIVNTARTVVNKNKTMPFVNQFRSTGLSRREKSFVICSCQAKSTRYLTLKYLATEAIKNHKIFTVYGNCGAVRKALVERGWVEKIPETKMNLTKLKNGSLTSKQEVQGELERILLSNLVQKHPTNFIWHIKDDIPIVCSPTDIMRDCVTIKNRLTVDALWTSKQGLCVSMKRNYWFYIEDVSEVSGPRTYTTYESGEVEDFEKDYKITACTSILKWVLSKVADDYPVFAPTGKISLNVLLFALNMCKEYLFRKQNKDIDQNLTPVTSGQWVYFLKKYYRVIDKQDIFKLEQENKLPLYLGYARCLLEEMYKYRPQLSCEGCHNVWIIKPAHNSRGRGIRLASKLAVITSLINKVNTKFVIQKYIEEPSLIYDTKFDIRQYYLVTSTYPLTIWMYRDCYLKFSSQKYNLSNYHESIHLTNNAVQRKYANCAGRHEDLPTNNMWHLEKYKNYLENLGKGEVWDELIYPSMKKSIVGVMLSSQDSLVASKHRFELYGCDFIIDKLYKPWLIEINSGPDLNHTTSVTAKICPAVIADIIKVVIDYPHDHNCSTGNFECIYRQAMTLPKFGPAIDMCVQGYALPNSYFYRGAVPVNLSVQDETLQIKKADSSRTIIKKMKQYYDLDTTLSEMKNNNTAVCNKKSEDELSVAATILTAQLEEFMDKLSSEKSVTFKPKAQSHILSAVSSINTVSDIITLTVEKESPMSTELDSSGEPTPLLTFAFSQLDDGPKGKGSTMGVPGTKKSNKCTLITNEKAVKSYYNTQTKITNVVNSKNIIEEATSEIVNFINQKEIEYFSELP